MTSGGCATVPRSVLMDKCKVLGEEVSSPFYLSVQKVLAPFQTQGLSTENTISTPPPQGGGTSVGRGTLPLAAV